jgi:hypothetical protein
VLNHSGDAAFIQHCQIRNVCRHLPEGQPHALQIQTRAVHEVTSVADAKHFPYKRHDQLVT